MLPSDVAIARLMDLQSKDGGLSTADTVADGGEDEAEKDSTYKPS